MDEKQEFFNDKDIARRFGFSPEWVRQDRFHRRHGRRHVLNFDPVMIGSKPRYRSEDVEALIAGLKQPLPHGGNHP